MIVKELIDELKKYPEDLLVECPCDDWGGFKEVEKIDMEEWYILGNKIQCVRLNPSHGC